MVGYADDFTAGGTVTSIKKCWNTQCKLGPKFGYHPKPSKTWLIVKNEFKEKAVKVFEGTGIKITTTGMRHLGPVIGSITYKEEYMNEKINIWLQELQMLTNIAKSEPQAAFSCFIAGYKHKFTYFTRTVPNISSLMKKIVDLITTEFIPAVTGGINCSVHERRLLALPPKLGGLGIPIFAEISEFEYNNSKLLTQNLCNKIIKQDRRYDPDNKIKEIKNNITASRLKRNHQTLQELRTQMSQHQIRLNHINEEKGVSSWISTLPLASEGYIMNKQLFWDLIRIRYGWELKRLPEKCACGSNFNLQHALSCKKGGFISIRHNQIRNITASLLKETSKDVRVEPILQQLTGENFNSRSAIITEEARLDISACGFWNAGQTAFFDIRVFNPNASRYGKTEISKCYEMNEKEKKKNYNERILQVEHGSFTPVVMTANGGFARESAKFYARLAGLIASKRNTQYSVVSAWIKRKVVFSLMNSIGLCVRGSR